MHKHKLSNNLITYFICLLVLFGVVLSGLYYFKESFTDNPSKIIADDLTANEDYQQCLSESNQISYLTNGKYLNCSDALSQLSSDGIDINSDIGFGQLSQLCPISSLASSPSDCLKTRLQKQNQTLQKTDEILKNSSKNTELIRMYNNIELDSYKKQMNKLFSDKEVLDTVKYIKENRLKTSNDEFETMLDDKINPSLTSISTSLKETTQQTQQNQRNQRNQYFNFDDSDMNIKKINNISILGY
jgi:hypothetical protein